MTFPLKRMLNYYGNENIFKNSEIVFKEGLNILIGPNGSGKTTTLHILEDALKKEIKEELKERENKNNSSETEFAYHFKDIQTKLKGKYETKYLFFNHVTTDSIQSLKPEWLNSDNYEWIATSMCSSEGQNVLLAFQYFLQEISYAISICSKIENSKLFVLIDDVDSRISIDVQIELIKLFEEVIIPDAKKRNVELYIILSTNTYEFVRNNGFVNKQCLDVYTGEEKCFKTYEDYRKYILDTASQINDA